MFPVWPSWPWGQWQGDRDLEKVMVTRPIHLLFSACTPDLFLNDMMVQKTVHTHHNNEEHPVYTANVLLSVQTM